MCILCWLRLDLSRPRRRGTSWWLLYGDVCQVDLSVASLGASVRLVIDLVLGDAVKPSFRRGTSGSVASDIAFHCLFWINCVFCILLMWPKYFNLFTTILFSTSWSRLSVSLIFVLRILSSLVTPSMRRRHVIFKTWRRFSSSFFIVHDSAPYSSIERISVWYNCILVWLLIFYVSYTYRTNKKKGIISLQIPKFPSRYENFPIISLPYYPFTHHALGSDSSKHFKSYLKWLFKSYLKWSFKSYLKWSFKSYLKWSL